MRYIWSAIVGRPGQSLGMLVLGLWAGLLAGVGPAFVAGADGEVVRTAVDSVSLREQMLFTLDAMRADGTRIENETFDASGGHLTLPGFDTVYSNQFNIMWVGSGSNLVTPLEYRSDVCAHLELLGRCPSGAGEIAIAQTAAAAHHVGVGSTVAFRQGSLVPNPEPPPVTPKWIGLPVGPTVTLTVVGVFTVTDAAALYWGTHPWAEDASDPAPIYASAATGRLFPLEVPTKPAFVLVPQAGAFTPERVEALPGEVDALKLSAEQARATMSTRTGELIARISAERRELRERTFAAVSVLAVIVWMLAYLLAAGEAERRRAEHGLLRLHGVPARWQFGLSAMSILVPLTAGYAAGLVLAPLAVSAGWSLVFPGTPTLATVGTTSALTVGAGLLLLASTALVAELRASTMDLMREVSRMRRRWIGVVVEMMGLLLAAVALIQLRSDPGKSSSLVAQLTPALLVAVGAATLSRVGLPIVRWIGRWALRHGRIATAISSLQVARGAVFRPLAVAMSLIVGFTLLATATADISQTARERQAELSIGADHLLQVIPVDTGHLLNAVHGIDPDGAFAMPVVVSGTVIAVDAPRLATVASWPAGLGDVAALGRELHPWPGVAVRLHTTNIRFSVDADLPPGVTLRFGVLAVPSGTDLWHSPTVPVTAGHHEVTVPTSLCLSGCRLAGISVQPDRPATGAITIRAAEPAPSGVAVDAGVLGDAQRWRFSGTGSVTGDGVKVQFTKDAIVTAYLDPDPSELPVVSTQRYTPHSLTMANLVVPVVATEPVTVIPRVVGGGSMIDLEGFDKVTSGDGSPDSYEVWLTADAPADVASRLEADGVKVIGERTFAGEIDAASRRATALGQRFTIVAAVLGGAAGLCGLALMVLLDRRRRAGQVASLAVQGLRRRTQKRLAWLSYALVGMIALVVGPVLAAAVFVALDPGARTGTQRAVVPLAPRPAVLLVVWAAMAVLLVMAPVVSTRLLKGRKR